MFKIIDENLTMEELLRDSADVVKPKLGSVIEGCVISMKKNHLVVDLNGVAVGIASGKDTHDSFGTMKELKEGDMVKAVVIQDENEHGMVVLSLRKASQSARWDRFEACYKTGEMIEVMVSQANKGGLLLDIDGIKGFIPVSQLAPVHYPRVEGANTTQILTRLQKLVGVKLNVKVINIDRESGKMILSEKAAQQEESRDALSKLIPGSHVVGKISGVVKFGIFVTFEGLEGLVHISEIAWGHVSDPHQYAKVGDKVEVEVIGIEGDKLSLSMKRLTPDPWQKIAESYPIGSTVKGVINRFSPFGAFVQLKDDINGLIHLSEIADSKVDDPEDFLTVGEEVEAKVINIDRDEHRIGLSLKGMGIKKKAKKKVEKEEGGEETAEEVKKDKPAKKGKKEEVKEEVAETVVLEDTETSKEEDKEEKPKKKVTKKKKEEAEEK